MVLHHVKGAVQGGVHIQITENLVRRNTLDGGDLLTIFTKDALCATKKMGELIGLNQKRKDLGVVFMNQIFQLLFRKGDEWGDHFVTLRPNLRAVFCEDIRNSGLIFS